MDTEKNEEKLQQNKDAIASMRLAQINMRKALDRIEQLERALKRASEDLDGASNYISESAYGYESREKLRDRVKKCAENARSHL